MAKQDYETVASENVKLPSGYFVSVEKKKHVKTGKVGINLSNKRFWFPISLEDADALADAIKKLKSM